ncbi:PqqD family protein [Aquamicrobium sp. LC103]|uniref:PqqD family peptide modification chaperone n=1 Tax=Aquamicrobium sp. LC103 TaxID=1120658 RepID=UPI00063E80D8|nr:PqqD family protein [Aquamicrobium sp. LC103]TKT74812.1 PqqD family peptide modification chaperone [Aquamicrobium sp. LC103]
MLVRCSLTALPLRFVDAGEVFDTLLAVTEGWSFAVLAGEVDGTALSISRNEEGFAIEEAGRETLHEPSAVSAACSLIVVLLNRMIEDEADLLCLHAGAVAIGGRTIVFPSTHRAGKSTLGAALAFRAHKVVADDILPLDCAGDGIRAIASGVAPRLRVPLPRALGLRFRFSAWRAAGPDDGYYRYLHLPSSLKCPLGERHELAAFVFLERSSGQRGAQLQAVDKASAMRSLLIQNFGTAAAPEAIVGRIDRLTDENPAFLLRYGDLGEAAMVLERSFGAAEPACRLWASLERTALPIRTVERVEPLRDGGERGERMICQRPGIVCKRTEGSAFLADPEHGGIFALDAVGAAVWMLMEEPVSVQELTCALGEAFSDVEPERIAADIDRLVQMLLANRLAVEAA